ncbi:Alpha/Beta hydrolase protein [Fomitopsis serialis]|uniref:Alpha/Beta hydrolase protein n=1 Tax=Fomitopsis serialis TaxID=139415 RepID=UPI002007F6DD|nr:Alpha/Beta hydrolase protein [Neoantrodia serialis]KAH9937240.1 Alpha/Beta hydrolase protein [Neoantrodia serialis]
MLAHVTEEIPQVVEAAGLPIDLTRQSIFGHSMGGHGALTIYLSAVLSGQKQYRVQGYLQGGIEEAKEKYDATELIGKTNKEPLHVLVDYGTGDNFYKQGQLLPENFSKAARDAGYGEVQVRVRSQEGYDHSYFFVRVPPGRPHGISSAVLTLPCLRFSQISTFGADHIHFHANFLKA